MEVDGIDAEKGVRGISCVIFNYNDLAFIGYRLAQDGTEFMYPFCTAELEKQGNCFGAKEGEYIVNDSKKNISEIIAWSTYQQAAEDQNEMIVDYDVVDKSRYCVYLLDILNNTGYEVARIKITNPYGNLPAEIYPYLPVSLPGFPFVPQLSDRHLTLSFQKSVLRVPWSHLPPDWYCLVHSCGLLLARDLAHSDLHLRNYLPLHGGNDVFLRLLRKLQRDRPTLLAHFPSFHHSDPFSSPSPPPSSPPFSLWQISERPSVLRGHFDRRPQ